MVLDICQAGHPVLRQPSRPLTRDEILSEECQELIQRMKRTLQAAPGVGLAAPQIGEPIQLAVIEDRPEYIAKWPAQQIMEFRRKPVPFYVLINPELELLKPEAQVLGFEGCLSVPGYTALVPRAGKVRVKYLDEKAEACEQIVEGWHARILQHEVDHLGGTLYLDHMFSRSFASQPNYLQHWSNKPIREVCRELEIGR